MSNAAFAKQFVTRAKKHAAEVKKHKHKAGNSFGPADVPDGTYSAVITMEASVPTKGTMEGVPIVRVKATINDGAHIGKEPSQSYFCEGKPQETADRPTAEQQVVALVQWLLPDMDISDVEQIPAAIDLVNERGPVCVIGVRNTTKADKKYQNVYFNKLLKSTSFEQETEVVSDDTTVSEPAEDGNEYVPAKDDIVTVDEHNGEYTVVQVSQSRRTVNLIDEEGSKLTGVPWTDLLLV